MPKIIFFILITISYNVLNGQTEYALEGRLFSMIDSSFVPASNIYTLPGKKGGISDKNGYFYMQITSLDTLYISTIGYRTYTIICRKLIEEKNLRLQIFLEPKVYELQGVDIVSFLTYEEFKVELLKIPLKESVEFDFSFESSLYAQLLRAPASGNFGIGINGALTGLYDHFSREGKEKRKLAQIILEDKKSEYLFTKFNPYMVQRATGLTNEEEIVKFMAFCGFSEYFLLNATDEELRVATIKKFEYYTRKSSYKQNENR
jgi:hypothetical protein